MFIMRQLLVSPVTKCLLICALLLVSGIGCCRHTGKAAFVGSVHYAKGTYVGVVMDDAETGKNNGEHTVACQCPGPLLFIA